MKNDCSGIKVGNSYCVEAPPSVTKTTTRPSTSTSPTPTGSPKPSPTQGGLIETCTRFYKAVKDDTCDAIVRRYGTFTVAQFKTWNPAVGATCSGLWADTYYCVGVEGTPTAPPTVTATGTPKPSPTQDGLIESCVRFYKAVADDSCDAVVAKHGGVFTLAQFLAWNPAVGSECRSLWAETYYCVGIPGTPTTLVTTTTARATTTTTRGNGIATPTPTQPGMVGNCNKFYFVKEGDTCHGIARNNGIPQAQLNIWNPSIGPGTSCTGLWRDVHVCVRTIGYTPLVTRTCHTGTSTKLWGDNKAAALEGATKWCNGGGSGSFTTGQRKTGCYNAPFGTNAIRFDILNDWGLGQSLTVAKCNSVVKNTINGCDRGGVAILESWKAT